MSKDLYLSFHGRVIDHLGYQMYHSPVAAISEMISNSWDADAESVEVTLPSILDQNAEIIVADTGKGMTFEECQHRFLNVGYDTREGNPEAVSTEKKRAILGRKGIGKFAGFGIAEKIKVCTISKETGERTVFELSLSKLRGEAYVGEGNKRIEVVEYEAPNEGRKENHGTIITLHPLQVKRNVSESVFARSMARRFLLHRRAKDFKVYINGNELIEDTDSEKIEYSFPRDYRENEKPVGLKIIEESWGIEKIDSDHFVKWNVVFYKEPIDDEELQGISIFAKGKLAQVPFLFNIVGGVGGQQGLEYISGRIEADYVDNFEHDIIATERQRINWELDESQSLLNWGRIKVKSLLRVWVDRRTESKIAQLTQKLSPFNDRLQKLPRFERNIVEGTLKKLAGIPRLSFSSFESLSTSILTAWEGGRLKDLIHAMSEVEEMAEGDFLDILLEANVLTALHTAEAVKVKLDTIRGLEDRINNRELENAIRDYIAESPWLLSPKWETFQKEKSVENIILEAAKEAKLDSDEDWQKRIDLTLSSGEQLLIVEFMRPGLRVDTDHLNRFEFYIDAVRTRIESNTGGKFKTVVGGYLVADKLQSNPTINKKLQKLALDGMYALDWQRLLKEAEAQWKDFLGILAQRTPNDDRVKALIDTNSSNGAIDVAVEV